MGFQTIKTYTVFPGEFSDNEKGLLLDAANLVSISYEQGPEILKHWARLRAGGAGTMPVQHYDVLNRLTKMPILIADASLGLQAFIAYYQPPGFNKEVLAVIVRGSNDVLDWFLNFQIRMVDFGSSTNGERLDGVKVHSGFHLQYLSMLGQCGQMIDEYLKVPDNIAMFAGHSLGGAVSSLLAMNYGSINQKRVWNLTFGSPRVGNQQFSTKCNEVVDLMWRVKNRRDPIPKALPALVGFRHVGEEIHLGSPDQFPDIPIFFDVGDHAHWNYILNLMEKGPEPPKPIVASDSLLNKIEQHVQDAKQQAQQGQQQQQKKKPTPKGGVSAA